MSARPMYVRIGGKRHMVWPSLKSERLGFVDVNGKVYLYDFTARVRVHLAHIWERSLAFDYGI